MQDGVSEDGRAYQPSGTSLTTYASPVPPPNFVGGALGVTGKSVDAVLPTR